MAEQLAARRALDLLRGQRFRIVRLGRRRLRRFRRRWKVVLAVLLPLALVALSGRAAIQRARSYVEDRYPAEGAPILRAVGLGVVRPSPGAHRAWAPFSLCWTVELDAGPGAAQLAIDPVTQEVLDEQSEL